MTRVIHFDITAADVSRATGIHQQAFGRRLSQAPGALDYWLIKAGASPDEPGIDGGLAQREADWQRITMFINIDCADVSARRVEAARGRIIHTRTVIPVSDSWRLVRTPRAMPSP